MRQEKLGPRGDGATRTPRAVGPVRARDRSLGGAPLGADATSVAARSRAVAVVRRLLADEQQHADGRVTVPCLESSCLLGAR
jgi:hypothetical protein